MWRAFEATSRISIRNIDNIHEEILEEVEANTLTPANTSQDDSSLLEKTRTIRPTPLNYAQEYLYIKMTTTRSTGSGGSGCGGMTVTSAAMGGVFTTSQSSKRHHTLLAPLREAKSARSLVGAVEDEEEVGKIRRPPSPLTLPRQEETQTDRQLREKRKKNRSRERKKEDSKLLRAQTVETKGEIWDLSKKNLSELLFFLQFVHTYL